MSELFEKLKSIPSELKSGKPLLVGMALTKLFLVCIIILAVLPQYTEAGGFQFRIWAFFLSPPNEIGDTFAGLAGVLAFMWIIITVWLQSQELTAQREELELTRKEFEKMANAQSRQVDMLKLQGEIFSEEQRQRAEEYSRKQAEEMLSHVIKLVVELLKTPQSFLFPDGKKIELKLSDSLPPELRSGAETGRYAGWVYFEALVKSLENLFPKMEIPSTVTPPPQLMRVNARLSELTGFVEKSGPALQAKFEDDGVQRTIKSLSAFLEGHQ